MIKIFILFLLLIINTSASTKESKETKKLNSDICEDAIKNGKILGYAGNSESFNIRFILEYNNKLYKYIVNRKSYIAKIPNNPNPHWSENAEINLYAECYGIDKKLN